MTRPTADGVGSPDDADLLALIDAERRAAAARDRRHAHWRRQRDDDSATLRQLLEDVAHQAIPVTVDSRVRDHRGTVTAVGRDFLALATSDEQILLVSFTALCTLLPDRVGDAPPSVARDRAPTADLTAESTLATVLRTLGEGGATVEIVVAGGSRHEGLVRAVGQDIVVLHADGGRRCYLATDAIWEVSVR